ncbi:ABC transporter ATP-binding protein [Peptacetobacter hominis]|uniref:ABC transporter ATP-binding protein n=1 Tax=Peptacetobacter hominis TaxID=2743610 RepID=A0A544QX07_9FIRM|nr:ABC transporter ATP-binding protein [Peptacetobacter hominis]TQQ85228.1 ABC transporter ATP-binding protein [Peptacetobacter hominis]
MSVIELKDISYRYPLEKEDTIKNVSCKFEAGKVYGLIGENGSGKTTICNIIRGFIPSFYKGELRGEVLLKDKKLEEYDYEDLASIIGYSFQNPFTQISGVKETVYEEIAYGLENLGVPREEIIKRVEELLDLFKLRELAQKNPYELSGGQKQRVALAAVVALDPEIIIMDEPTSQLDPKSTADIFEIIDILKKQKKVVILVEHKIDLVAQYCDSIIFMHDGECKLSGTAREVLTNPKVLEMGGQLPQVTLYFLERIKRGEKFDMIPLNVKEAYSILKGEE